MKIEDFSVTKLKGAVNDPKILKKARTMYPDLQSMSDKDFARLMAWADEECDKVLARYGDLSGTEILEYGKKLE